MELILDFKEYFLMSFSRRQFINGLGVAGVSMVASSFTDLGQKASLAASLPQPQFPALPSLPKLHLSHFAGLVQSPFHFQSPETLNGATLHLAQITKFNHDPKLHQFALKFYGPKHQVMDNTVYQVQHPELGLFDLAIEFKGEEVGQACYEAIICNMA